jgi:pyrimidine-nucleoside phosphorylase
MLASSLLIKKRDGHPLEDDEIRFLVEGYGSGEVADYQMSALAMAICLRGMNSREITTLTRAMLDSGDTLAREDRGDRVRVDKHSTGGLGDKVSLILVPLLASLGLDVPMISGRGLGRTGGTLDKLESIEGFQVQLSPQASSKVLREVGAFIIGASQRIAPADRQLYALRDVTGTVESVALITASILSKKLAANLDALVMDVKTGSGAFMKTEAEAVELAQSLVRVGNQAGLPTSAMLSDMDQPLGDSVGNAIEVNEAVEILRGDRDLSTGSRVVRELTLELCSDLLLRTEIQADREECRRRLAATLERGDAMERFERLVRVQGGRWTGPLPLATAHVITTAASGYLAGFDCPTIGDALVSLGAGRRKTGDRVDHRVGIRVHGRIGDRFEQGQPIFTLHCHAHHAADYVEVLRGAVRMSESPVAQRPLILRRFDL